MSPGACFGAESWITKLALGAGHPGGRNPARPWMPEQESPRGTQKLQIVTPLVILLVGLMVSEGNEGFVGTCEEGDERLGKESEKRSNSEIKIISGL